MKHNIYFDGAVQSLGFSHRMGDATVGVMEPGEYDFSTGAKERMQIVSGEIDYQLPGGDWQSVTAPGEFHVPGNTKFKVRMKHQVAYVCWFG